ncbi:hypothetical protein SEA_JKERNS_11 [Arthrobacter phage JKerns]|uniref:Uncharacterized protein n=3 Tax=Marthavirus TaxID=1980936 RepID=A0A0U4IXS3_9CAUD|nr:hypothetical protein FDH50_gp11 [Arthrobacter phage Sonny]YP_009612464.1 hypothetical protein FDI42_gp11 [Arthrobacter phage Shade]ALY10279.1 hypothetical protein SONNY_11 [Arthrobacter phage Sonny]ASR80716.1 hypothetical protein SEA_SHADE_11 [Arthrobacter phage Shade]QIQ62823.1 hypothetical protein SEA_JKERNS_11 [Arthrobacter phage JKerns]
MADPQKWGVTVDEVSALAPHIGLYDGSTTEPTPADDVFGETAKGKVSRADVERFIADVAGRVELRLLRLPRLIPDTATATVIARACHDVVVNGAAHYLVAAAFPSNAGLNDDTTLSGLLWKRFEDGLDDLAAQLDGVIKDGDDTVVLPAKLRSAASGNFPPVMFPDEQRW